MLLCWGLHNQFVKPTLFKMNAHFNDMAIRLKSLEDHFACKVTGRLERLIPTISQSSRIGTCRGMICPLGRVTLDPTGFCISHKNRKLRPMFYDECYRWAVNKCHSVGRPGVQYVERQCMISYFESLENKSIVVFSMTLWLEAIISATKKGHGFLGWSSCCCER